ncbi:MAG TPA: hypothetical protein VFN06_00495, partial [Gaiellaceae bacterium]|nr:hypothetical protein [Gaiellaceae bacterium]
MTWLHGGRRIATVCACLAGATLVSSVAAGAAPEAAKNLIVNGDAEQGPASPNGYDVVADIPGWARKGGFTVVSYGAADFPGVQAGSAIGGGSSFFAGGPGNAGSSVSQQISIASKKSLIDSGKGKATLSGYLGGYGGQDDSLAATAVFLDQSGKRLGGIKIGPVSAAARKLQTGMLKKTTTGLVPKKTRTIRIVLGADRTAG